MTTKLLIPITEGSDKPPFHIIPSAGSTPLSLINLARSLPSKRSVNSFMFAGMEDERSPHASIEEMASDYVAEIMEIQNSGPYFIGGHCFGGTVAYEMAAQLEAAGESVAVLALLESIPPLPNEETQSLNGDDGRSPSTGFSTAAKEAVQVWIDQIEQQLSRLPAQQMEHYSRITRQHLHIVNIYRATPIAAPIVQLRSSTHQDKAFADWKYFSTQGYSERIVPGDSYSMLNPPHVGILGAKLDKTLQESDK